MTGRCLLGDPAVVEFANGGAIRGRQRAAIRTGAKGIELVERLCGLKAALAKHRDFFTAAAGFGEGAGELDLADADVREFALAQEVGAADVCLGEPALEVIGVALVDLEDRGARFVGGRWGR